VKLIHSKKNLTICLVGNLVEHGGLGLIRFGERQLTVSGRTGASLEVHGI
jgi:hypothetical protein